MSRRKVIGEGSYGCIHQPSLHCKENIPLDYDKYISKLMKTTNAEKELREFVMISNLDKTNEYHLGTPTICEPDTKDPAFDDDIEECMHFNSSKIMGHPNEYRLLIQKSGGYDLSYFCKHELKNFVNENPQNNLVFWLQVYHLLKGIHFFKKHDIVHYDLKPQNIVFNPETKKFMFIDFGLMNKKTHIINRSKTSVNYTANFHWSYPIDNGFLNKNYFEYYKKLSKPNKENFKNTFYQKIFNDTGKSTNLKLQIKNAGGFQLFFSYIYLQPLGVSDRTQRIRNVTKTYNDISAFFDSYNDSIKTQSYEKVIDKTVDSIDIYGLGFTLKFVLNQFFQIGAIPEEFYRKAANLFEDMYNFNFNLRVVSIDKIMDVYEQILLETGVLYALNKQIENREIIDNKIVVPDIVSIADTTPVLIDPVNLTPELEDYAHKDAFEVPNGSTSCKDSNKEVNPLTKRCVKKCTAPKIRNNKFRCVNPKRSITVKKSKYTTNIISCSETKERNPLTKRCVKKCPHNRIRDACFRCISATRKIMNKVDQICSDSKEINPSSGRCVKKCTHNKIRNNCFRCVTKKNIIL
uniref:Protein kinase domain-containing protein n=1 Tax=viral metagenome TaxID=1070528 RepID=A0A6C0E1K9_9ZZZZ